MYFGICLRCVRYGFVIYRFVRYRFTFVRYRHPQETFRLSTRRLEVVFKTCFQDAFKTYFQDLFSVTIFRLPRRFKEIFKAALKRLVRCLQDVIKTSWKTKNCYAEDMLKTSSRHVLKTCSRCLEDQQLFAGKHMIQEYVLTFALDLLILC